MPFRLRLGASLLFASLTALSLSSAAAQVQLYGVVDMGFSLARASGNGPNAGDGHWSMAMKSGMGNSSRIGLRGSERLDNGLTVGFILENQFKADTGEFQSTGTLWERESSLWVSGDFGKVSVGKLGKLRSPVGSTGLFTTNNVNPFGNAMSSFIGGHKTVTVGDYFPHNNSIVYATPRLAQHWELFAQYSFGDKDDQGTFDNNERYMALAARFQSEALKATLVLDTIDEANRSDRSEQPSSATLAVNYNFGFIQPFVLVQAFRSSPINAVGSDAQRGYMKGVGKYDGWGSFVALRMPVWGGLAKVGAGYLDANSTVSATRDVKRYVVSVGYDYKLSKTLDWYADLGYVQQKTQATGSHVLRGTEFAVGMVKFF